MLWRLMSSITMHRGDTDWTQLLLRGRSRTVLMLIKKKMRKGKMRRRDNELERKMVGA